MDLFDVFKSCGRRWYILLPLLLITAWYSHSAYTSVKPVYYSQAIVGLAPPSNRYDSAPNGGPTPRNGLLDIGGAALIANMASLALRQPAVIDQVVAGGGQADYVARMYPTPATMPQLPMIMLEVTAPDPTTATKTLELVLGQSNTAVREPQLQAQVPQELLVDPFVVAPPTEPAGGTPSRMRSTLSIFITGIGLSVLATVVLDVILTRRRSKISTHQPADDVSPEAGPEPHPRHATEASLEVSHAVPGSEVVAESK